MGLVWVGIGGALGTMLRLSFSMIAARFIIEYSFLATLSANVLGAALIGYLATRELSVNARAMWMTGFCGGFTTFSFFSFELVLLVEQNLRLALGYAGLSLVLWLLAVWGGWRLGTAKRA